MLKSLAFFSFLLGRDLAISRGMRCSAIEIFELKESFSEGELKRAFRRKLQLFHPDRMNGKTNVFHELLKAFELLRDPEKRELLGDRPLFNRALFFPLNSFNSEANQLLQNLSEIEGAS